MAESFEKSRFPGLARWPVLVFCILVLGGSYWVAFVRLGPRFLPGLFAAGKGEPAAAATPEIADVRAVEGILGAVQEAIRGKEYEKARTILEAAVVEYERDQTLHLALADLYVRLSRPETGELSDGERLGFESKAYGQFTRALEIGPRTAEMEFSAGSLARDLGDSDSAIAHFMAARQADTANAAYPLHLAQVYFNRNELDEAKAQLAVSLSLDDENAISWGMMAEIALRQNSPRIALQQLDRATALEPGEPAWRQMQARAYNRLGEPEAALRSLDLLPEKDRFDVTSLELAGQSLGLEHEPERALERYEAAISAGVVDPQVYLDAATWAERLGHKERAIELATIAAGLDVRGADRMLARLQQKSGE